MPQQSRQTQIQVWEKPSRHWIPFINITQQRTLICFGKAIPLTNNTKSLASEDQANMPNQFSYLWPYSGTFSAVNALLEATHDKKYQQLLDKRVLPGLEEYFDIQRTPNAYSSYIQTAPTSDRFYDDNVWLGIDFTDIYQITQEKRYLDKAQLIWKFIESGTDSLLGGGIYWCEQKKESKNTCSNAPGLNYLKQLMTASTSDKEKNYMNGRKRIYKTPLITSILTISVLTER